MPKKQQPPTDLFAAIAKYQQRKATGKATRVIKESEVESKWRKWHASLGSLMLKFVSPARRSVPDDILLNPIPPEHRELVARYFRFIEFKRPGEKPTESQHREHERYRALGFTVDVIDYLPPKD